MPNPSRLEALLTARRLPWALGALAALIVAPAIGSGLVADDYVIGAAELASRESAGGPTPLDAFHFMVPSDYHALLDAGVLPWWASPELKLAFFRPLASASHWIDFHVFPGAPVLMHLFSIAWLVATVVVATRLYRRLLGNGWPAGLAALYFALDPGHALSAAWVSTRNAVLAACFGLGAVLLHDRWRRDGVRWAAWAAPLLTAASLGSAEAGVATLGLLGAHAIAFDGPGLGRRARALAPHAAVALAWAAIYRAGGHGTAHSAMYTDPLGSPGDFLRGALLGIPINLGARFGGIPASLALFCADRALPAVAVLGLVFVIAVLAALAKVLRQDPAARFFALGAIFAVLPIAATLPNDRNLFLVGFAAFGLVAMAIRRAVEERSILLRLYAGWLLVLLVLSVPSGVANARGMDLFIRFSRDPLSRVLLDEATREKTAIFVNPPAQFFVSHLRAMRHGTGEPLPARIRCLWPGFYGAEVTRTRDDQIEVRVPGGILPRPGTWPAAPGEAPRIKGEYMAQHLTSFVRGVRDPMHAGDVIEMPGLRVVVVEVAEGGSPSLVTFTFDRSLDDASLRWLVWKDGGYALFTPPPLGERVSFPPVPIHLYEKPNR
jgi:hypothetical protein